MIRLLKQFAPLSSKTRYYIVTGGRGSAKSFHVALFLLNLTYKQSHSILFTRWTLTSAHISIIPEFREKIELLKVDADFIQTKTEIVNRLTGNQILFRGIKTSQGTATANLKSLQGITTWVLDEAEELVDESIFDKIDLSIRKKGVQNRIILILNPTTKDHWIYRRFFEERGIEAGTNASIGDTTYIHTTWEDNRANLDPSFIAQAELLKATNPSKYHHIMLGGWLDRAEGVIFTNWRYGHPDTSLPIRYGLDFGYSIDPTALTEVRVDEKRKLLYVRAVCYRKGMTTADIAQQLTVTGRNIIKADSAEPRLIDELRSKGFNIEPCTKGADSVRAGLMKMLDYEIIVHPDSIEIGKELNNYTWSDKKSNTPIDAYNHAIDSIRYAVFEPTVHKMGKFRST